MNLLAHFSRADGEPYVRIYDLDANAPAAHVAGGSHWTDGGALLSLHAVSDGSPMEPDNTYLSSRTAEQMEIRRGIIRALEIWDEHGNRRRMRIGEALAALEEMGVDIVKAEERIG